MMATVPHVTSGLGLRKFQADGFLLTRVYINRGCKRLSEACVSSCVCFEHRDFCTVRQVLQGSSEIIMRFGDDELWKREGRHGDDGPSISGMTKENKKIARDLKV